MRYEEIQRTREEIEGWVRLIGKRRTEECLGISIHNLEEPEHSSVVYE